MSTVQQRQQRQQPSNSKNGRKRRFLESSSDEESTESSSLSIEDEHERAWISRGDERVPTSAAAVVSSETSTAQRTNTTATATTTTTTCSFTGAKSNEKKVSYHRVSYSPSSTFIPQTTTKTANPQEQQNSVSTKEEEKQHDDQCSVASDDTDDELMRPIWGEGKNQPKKASRNPKTTRYNRSWNKTSSCSTPAFDHPLIETDDGNDIFSALSKKSSMHKTTQNQRTKKKNNHYSSDSDSCKLDIDDKEGGDDEVSSVATDELVRRLTGKPVPKQKQQPHTQPLPNQESSWTLTGQTVVEFPAGPKLPLPTPVVVTVAAPVLSPAEQFTLPEQDDSSVSSTSSSNHIEKDATQVKQPAASSNTISRNNIASSNPPHLQRAETQPSRQKQTLTDASTTSLSGTDQQQPTTRPRQYVGNPYHKKSDLLKQQQQQQALVHGPRSPPSQQTTCHHSKDPNPNENPLISSQPTATESAFALGYQKPPETHEYEWMDQDQLGENQLEEFAFFGGNRPKALAETNSDNKNNSNNVVVDLTNDNQQHTGPIIRQGLRSPTQCFQPGRMQSMALRTKPQTMHFQEEDIEAFSDDDGGSSDARAFGFSPARRFKNTGPQFPTEEYFMNNNGYSSRQYFGSHGQFENAPPHQDHGFQEHEHDGNFTVSAPAASSPYQPSFERFRRRTQVTRQPAGPGIKRHGGVPLPAEWSSSSNNNNNNNNHHNQATKRRRIRNPATSNTAFVSGAVPSQTNHSGSTLLTAFNTHNHASASATNRSIMQRFASRSATDSIPTVRNDIRGGSGVGAGHYQVVQDNNSKSIHNESYDDDDAEDAWARPSARGSGRGRGRGRGRGKGAKRGGSGGKERGLYSSRGRGRGDRSGSSRGRDSGRPGYRTNGNANAWSDYGTSSHGWVPSSAKDGSNLGHVGGAEISF